MRVLEIWRYPAKSMAGERLAEAELTEGGIAGDRILQVRRADGRIVDARAHPRMLGHHATLVADGNPLVDGRPWDSPEVARDVEAAAGPGTRLVRSQGFERFDVLPLLVATDGAIAAFGRDGRRLRPNIVIADVAGLDERAWAGRELRIGEVRLGIHSLRDRCVMTTYDPDTLQQDPNVLKDIVRRFDGKLALNCWVIRGGRIRVGDSVQLADAAEAASPGQVWGRYA